LTISAERMMIAI